MYAYLWMFKLNIQYIFHSFSIAKRENKNEREIYLDKRENITIAIYIRDASNIYAHIKN